MAQAVNRATRAAAQAVAEIDAELRAIQDEIADRRKRATELRRQRARWAKLSEPEERVAVDSMAVAGPAAVKAVAAALRGCGTAYQYEITKATGLNSGTVTHALRVLARDHKIAATGRKRRNSPEYEWTSDEREPAIA